MSDIFSSFMAQTASVVLHKKNVAWGRTASLILLHCISHLKLYVIVCQRKWDKGSKIHEFKGVELRLRDISLVQEAMFPVIIKGCSHTISHHHPHSTAYFVRKCCKLVFYECLLCVNLSHCFLLLSVIFNLLQEVNQTFLGNTPKQFLVERWVRDQNLN